ncbi:NADH:flavin oxidoreductase/NADH oxidase [Brevibacillus daliensis]|uniref:NADH:flavin oxidoreductase/NADH oxidase n=1 Tax=Brevibacillus daliensis TaxID=2892995 RepID=UPI001E2BD62F|nr:NADH:flavin oxidoreductase/NADH oxidase [Brevibacillus daliensis]
MSHMFTPYHIKSLELKNRVVMAPMCQYSVTKEDGIPNEWHFVHYTSRAVGGAGLIIIEMTNVEPDGRISNNCLGLWSDEHIPAFSRIIKSCQQYGSKVAIQIAHAGRKAEDAKQPVAPSAIAYSEKYNTPRELSTEEVKGMVEKYKAAARRAVEAGVDSIELHGAHGYLIHQFHSSLTNKRDDEYGKRLTLFGEEVVRAVKSVMPEDMPLIMRVSAKEYVENGYDLPEAIEFCQAYKEAGVDVFHVSSGGEGKPFKKLSMTPGYQVELAEKMKAALNIPVIAVGILDDPALAEQVLEENQADLVAIGRAMLREPYWALQASRILDGTCEPPKQYIRGF